MDVTFFYEKDDSSVKRRKFAIICIYIFYLTMINLIMVKITMINIIMVKVTIVT